MKELNIAETQMVTGAASTGLADSIGGAIVWTAYTDGITSGILAAWVS